MASACSGPRSGEQEHHVPEPGLLSRGPEGHGPGLPRDPHRHR